MSFVISLFALVFVAVDMPLEDPRQEARAQSLMREIRCVACENEPISESAAPIAEDMRVKVRELIADGASDEEVRQWFVARYDDFVLFRPPTRGISGALLWGLPFVLLVTIGGAIVVSRRGRADLAPVPIDPIDHENGTDG